MFSHIFKLIWKKKKSNFLMMLEIFLSFLILFAVWSLSVYSYRNYLTPAGLSAENVWSVAFDFQTSNDSVSRHYKELVRQYLRTAPEIEALAFSEANVPFSNSQFTMNFRYRDREASSNVMSVDASLPAVLGIPVAAGRWFRAEDTIGGTIPVVITRHLATELFGAEDPLGKIIGYDDEDRKQVVGVVDHYRHSSSFQEDGNAVFKPSGRGESTLLLKLRPAANNATYEATLARSLQQLGKDWTVEIQYLENMQATKDKMVLIPLLILAIVCGFLVFNVALGLFGVLFQHISRRRGEIGIRRAVGATKRQIWRYFVGETLVIATFGVLLGLFFAVQIPLLQVLDVESAVYVWGMILAALSIYAIAFACAFYPSRQAAAIYPAIALHEE